MASYYCITVELEKALERHKEGKSIVIPVILSDCIIDQSAPFYGLMRVPEDGKPIQKFKPQVDGYVNAITKIKQMIDKNFSNTRKSSVKEPSSPLSIPLYQNGKEKPYVLDDITWDAIQKTKNKIVDFQKIASEKLIDFILLYKQDFPKAKKNENLKNFRYKKFKSFLIDISAAVRDWIFSYAGIRIHFRVINKEKKYYVGFTVVDGKAKSTVSIDFSKKITPIPSTSGMIFYSGEYNTPLIKSKNDELHEKGKNDEIYTDYITSALKLKGLYNSPSPLMSLGISIEKEYNKKYAPYLIALSFLKFDVTIENMITTLCIETKKIDKDFDLKDIISYKM